MKKAFITGITGQDGSYLAELLLENGYKVCGTMLPGTTLPAELVGRVGIFEIDLCESAELARLVHTVSPDEVYHLAAHHFSSQGDENRKGLAGPFLSVNLVAANTMLEFIKCERPRSRFFYAASAHIFGSPDSCPQTEQTPHRPETAYAISKSAGVLLCRYYRETHGLHASAGILYNHESPRRTADFVTMRIARAAALASMGRGEPLYLKNIRAVVDWGAARDYVGAMRLLLQQPSGSECLISSGVPRTVWELAEEAFNSVGLKADKFVFQAENIIQSDSVPYVGDNSKIREICGWIPTISFSKMVAEMVQFQLEQLKGW